MKLILVRHGETDFNKERRFQGQLDEPLNKEGEKQAKRLANILKDANIDIIISSPLKRALKTAEIINKYHNKEIILEDLAKERGFGKLEGEKYENVDFKKIALNNEYEKYGIESDKKFLERVKKLLKKLIKNYKNKNVLLVTHAGIIKFILSIVLELDLEVALTKINKKNCTLTIIDFSDENPKLIGLNTLDSSLIK